MDRVEEILSTHDSSEPLFLFIAIQNNNAPLDLIPNSYFDSEGDFKWILALLDTAIEPGRLHGRPHEWAQHLR
jgi:hypothetical protein